MKPVILNILCEGQTEERFAGKVLKPYLKSFGVIVKTQILVTNKKKNIRGGIISYNQVKRDLSLWVKQNSHKTYEQHYYTSMLDLYALPSDFPSYEDAMKIVDKYKRVEQLEDQFWKDNQIREFIPYIQLHEFEALVFCGLDYLLIDYPDMTKQIKNLKTLLNTKYADNPELVNDNPKTTPSKRIIKEFEQYHHYDKPKSGELITSKVGIESLKTKCKHFGKWIEKLENLKSA